MRLLAAHAEAKFASANKREQLVGLEQIFELLSQRANLHGITDVLLDEVVGLLSIEEAMAAVVSSDAVSNPLMRTILIRLP